MRRSVSFSIKLNDTGMPETMEGTTPSIRHCTSQARYSDISERSKRYRTLIMVRALLNLVVMAEDGRLWRRRRRRFGFFRTTPGTPIRDPCVIHRNKCPCSSYGDNHSDAIKVGSGRRQLYPTSRSLEECKTIRRGCALRFEA